MKFSYFRSDSAAYSIFLRFLASLILIGILFKARHLYGQLTGAYLILGLMGVVFCIYMLLFIHVPRFRDMGFPAWLVIFLLIPIFNIFVLLFLLVGATDLRRPQIS